MHELHVKLTQKGETIMDRDLQNIVLNDFEGNKSEEIEEYYLRLQRIISDAIQLDTLESVKSLLEKVSEDFERINNLLEINNSEKSVFFNYGRIVSIVNLALETANFDEIDEMLKSLLKSYKMLLPALNIISEYSIISGVDLKREMKIKSNSSLSNFLNRIKKYRIVDIKKIGNTNYISLTSKGKRVLQLAQESDKKTAESSISLKDALRLLDQLSEELESLSPNSIKIVCGFTQKHLSQSEKSLIKQKIDSIFTSRDTFFKKQIGNRSYNKKGLDDISVSFDFYDSFTHEIEESYGQKVYEALATY